MINLGSFGGISSEIHQDFSRNSTKKFFRKFLKEILQKPLQMSSLQEFEVHLGILSGISPRFFSGNVPQIVSMNFENFPHDFVRNSSRILQGFFFSNLVKEFLWQFFQDILHESFRTSSRNLFRFYSKRCFRNSFQVFFSGNLSEILVGFVL